MSDITIGVDGYNMAMPNGTGVATYGVALTEAIQSMGIDVTGVFGVPVGANPRLREVLFYEALGQGITAPRGWIGRRLLRTFLQSFTVPRVQELPVSDLVQRRPFEFRIPDFQRIVSAAHLFERADLHFRRTRRFMTLTMEAPPAIMHWTYPVPIQLRGARNVYTLHDLVPLRLPHTTLDRKRIYYQLIQRCVSSAAHICTVSESSRDDIVSAFPEVGERITNTYQHSVIPSQGGVSSREDADDIEGIFGLGRRGYYLYYGAIEPKKNVGRLLEAYLSLRTSVPLVIVGARAWQAEGELRLTALDTGGVRSTGAAGGRIIRLDYLPRRLLMKLVRGARAVMFPSLYEGFGLPVLEAMMLGTPVLTSDRSSLPEVAGDAALKVDPYDVRAITEALTRLDTDPDLCERLSRMGIVQARSFTLAHHRERLHAMYGKVLTQPPL